MKKLILVILSVAPLFVFGQTNVKSYENTNVVVGAKRPENSSVILEAESTTKGFLPPRMTSTQRNAMTPVGGLTIYNSTDSVMQHYDSLVTQTDTIYYIRYDNSLRTLMGKPDTLFIPSSIK